MQTNKQLCAALERAKRKDDRKTVELAKRGLALEQIKHLVDGCVDLMSPELHKKLAEIVYKYVERQSGLKTK